MHASKRKASAIAFFFANAAYNYNMETETPEIGRINGAKKLAQAEEEAWDIGLSYEWRVDPEITSANWSEDPDPWSTWECNVRDDAGVVLVGLERDRLRARRESMGKQVPAA